MILPSFANFLIFVSSTSSVNSFSLENTKESKLLLLGLEIIEIISHHLIPANNILTKHF